LLFAFRSFAALCETFAAFAVKLRTDCKVREAKPQSYAKEILFQIQGSIAS
jgi:hypothetical protein